MRNLIRQVVVFAVIFLAFQVGAEWVQGQPLTQDILTRLVMVSAGAAVVFGILVFVFKKRNNRED